jgi:hypothetical protein
VIGSAPASRRYDTRRRRLALGLAAAAAAAAVAAALAIPKLSDDSVPELLLTPPTPYPTPSPALPPKLGPPLVNGRITDAQTYLRSRAGHYQWRAFDPGSRTGLFAIESSSGAFKGLTVVRPRGPVATLTCARDLPCSADKGRPDGATLGPGPDEVTIGSGSQQARVVGFDGIDGQTLNLGDMIPGDWTLASLRWSPDGSRLAVVTSERRRSRSQVTTGLWLVDPKGGDAQLAYSLVYEWEVPGQGVIWSSSNWGWSPDGRALLLDVENPDSNVADVVVVRLQADGHVDSAQTLYHSHRFFDTGGNVSWSPDGTRIAVRTRVPRTTYNNHRITKISADDGAVLAHHPDVPNWLIWPARHQ